jgi:hypothetical protein
MSSLSRKAFFISVSHGDVPSEFHPCAIKTVLLDGEKTEGTVFSLKT